MIEALKPIGTPAQVQTQDPPTKKAAPIAFIEPLRDTKSELAAPSRLVPPVMPEPFRLKTPAARREFEASLAQALPQASYDPQGFLASLGLRDLRSSGRTDAGVQQAYMATRLPGEARFQPGPENIPEKMRFLHKPFLKLLELSPGAFRVTAKAFDKYALSPRDLHEAKLAEDISKIGTNGPKSLETPRERYHATKAVKDLGWGGAGKAQGYGRDFHEGLPANGGTEPTQAHGTYSIARQLGFSDTMARRFAVQDYGVDENITRYGQTVSGKGEDGAISRHFNVRPQGEQDSRLAWAQKHLDLAVSLAKQGFYERAEEELGVGLHSLQDLFAHGQIKPMTHMILGEFPDTIGYNPVGFDEVTLATERYLLTYLKRVLA